MTFMEALARQEGFEIPGTLAARRHNPGNILESKFAQRHGAVPSDGEHFAKFPDDATGFAAMRALLLGSYSGLPVRKAILKWAPATENDTNIYIKNVCSWTGLTPTTRLTPELIG